MWTVSKMGAAGSCPGHLRGQWDFGTARPMLAFNMDGFWRRGFLFACLPRSHEMQFWGIFLSLLLPTQFPSGRAVSRSSTEGLPA